MKTVIVIVVLFLIGGFCFFELPDYKKAKIDQSNSSGQVVLKENKLKVLISKIEVEQKEVEVMLDSIN